MNWRSAKKISLRRSRPRVAVGQNSTRRRNERRQGIPSEAIVQAPGPERRDPSRRKSRERGPAATSRSLSQEQRQAAARPRGYAASRGRTRP